MELKKLVGTRIILFTKKNFRFQGLVKGINDGFLEILDDVKNTSKMINLNEISEIEIDDGKKTKRP